MGFDIYGLCPDSEVGRYFGRNFVGWPMLWDYCASVSPITEKVKMAYTNDGDGLDAVDALQLAKALQDEITSGRCEAVFTAAEFGQPRRRQQNPFESCEDHVKARVQNIREFAIFLQHCGGFEIL
jgi:hypothetical protein